MNVLARGAGGRRSLLLRLCLPYRRGLGTHFTRENQTSSQYLGSGRGKRREFAGDSRQVSKRRSDRLRVRESCKASARPASKSCSTDPHVKSGGRPWGLAPILLEYHDLTSDRRSFNGSSSGPHLPLLPRRQKFWAARCRIGGMKRRRPQRWSGDSGIFALGLLLLVFAYAAAHSVEATHSAAKTSAGDRLPAPKISSQCKTLVRCSWQAL